jgi:hypothetical protein
MNFYGARSVKSRMEDLGRWWQNYAAGLKVKCGLALKVTCLGGCLYKPLVCPDTTFVNQLRKTTKHHVQAGTYQVQPLYNQPYTRTLFYLTIATCHFPSALVTLTCNVTRIFESKENVSLALNMLN